MKKIFITILLLTICSSCHAQDESYTDNQQKIDEIKLRTNTPQKTYNLSKPNYNNPKEEYHYEDEDNNEDVVPFKFMQTPLNMLKQYQEQ